MIEFSILSINDNNSQKYSWRYLLFCVILQKQQLYPDEKAYYRFCNQRE